MTTDLNLFSEIANRLIYLTTKDEYGSSRSRGIGNLNELSDDLNDFGIVPARGYWTENSLKLFFCRIRRRYTVEDMASGCDFDFLGRQSWEYLSHTRREDVCESRSVKPNSHWRMPAEPYSLEKFEGSDIQSWKTHEMDEVLAYDKKMIKILKGVTPKRSLAH